MSAREVHTSTKKASRQNAGQSLLNHSSSSHQQHTLFNIKLEQDDAASSLFYHEISDIMRGFGDCDRPLRESVILVEKILQQQLKGILHDAIDISVRRKGIANPTQSDFEFLMRKHPIRINRMRKHIKDMRLLRKILKYQAQRPPTLSAAAAVAAADEINSNQDSDEEIDFGNLPEKFDEERIRRLFRADRISQILSGVQYQEYNEARRTSFYCRQSEKMKQKFRQFLLIPNDIILSHSCYTILAYLAHETIATIVDYAILTRLNSDNRLTEPFSRVTSSGASFGMLHLCPEVSQGRGLDGVKPITVQEIQEAMRRFNQCARRGMGFHRNNVDADMRKCYLAI